MPTPDPTRLDQTCTVRGLRLRTRRRPGDTAPPLLLIQGLGGSSESWEPLIRELPGRDIVMVDNPGSGRSESPLLPLRLATVADMLVGALDHLGIEDVDVLGFSLGGLVAQELVRRHPRRVRRLVLASTTFGLGAMVPGWRVQRVLWSPGRFHSSEVAADAMRILAGGRTAADPAVLGEILDVRADTAPTVRGYYSQLASACWWSSLWWLHTLDVPALVLHGEADPLVPLRNARMLARRLPDARLEIIAGGGHMILFDQSADVAPSLITFFDA